MTHPTPPLLPCPHGRYLNCCACAVAEALAAPTPAPVGEPWEPTNTYVYAVPSEADRITWRGQYIHFPLARQQPAPSADAVVAAARDVNRIFTTATNSKDLYLYGDEADALAALRAALAELDKGK